MKRIILSVVFIASLLGGTSTSFALKCGTNKECLDACTQGFRILIPICL